MAAFAEGVPCWADAMLPDLEAGKRFYGGLFGWTFDERTTDYGSYTRALLGGKDVAGLVPKPDGRMPTVWNIYFATRDAAATAARIREAGGRVIAPPVWIDDSCVMATAADPGGAVFGLWQAGSHPGFARRGTPGSYGWTEVHTRQPRPVDSFYRAVFGYGMEPVSVRGARDTGPCEPRDTHAPASAPAPDLVLWSPRGEPTGARHAIGGRVVIGERYPAELPAHFLTYFVVADCDQALRTAHRLGGRVLNDPEDTPYGRFAVLADNQGAVFAVIDTSATGPSDAGSRAGPG
ncbi:VOC family protein [Streptomyces cucumeris]|uniref:VOC family protein n=1 Tax=Streptomyces cucumeris TaxID=2962890 RepID=UPI0020C8FA3C|nr:VOC family protein [Streptomyces sp. NEAU-Y11]MCP9208663.1 VOC family protein [Streptomyces sp. NEAU-Y11]